MLFRRPTPVLPVCLLLLHLSSAQAESAVIRDTETTVVTATKETDLNALNTPNYQILHREDFIDSSQTLGDLLQKINGIQIRQISGLGNPASVSIRGSSSKQVQLYIDGQLINDSQFGGFDVNQLPTEQIDSIEISKSQALGTGSTPIGGVIRINTYNPQIDSARISLASGSFGYREVNLMANKLFTNYSLAAGFSHVQSDNNYSYQVPQNFVVPSISTKEKLANNAYEKNALHLNSEIYLGQHLLRFNMQYTEQRKELANYQNNSPENTSEISSDSWRFGYLHNWQSSHVWLAQVELEAYTQFTDEIYLEQPTGVMNKRANYQSVKSFAGIKPTLNAGDLVITPFINFNHQIFESTTVLKGQATPCNGINSCDVTASQQQLNYGTRLEWPIVQLALTPYALISQSQEQNANSVLNKSGSKHIDEQDYTTQELGITYQPNKFNAVVDDRFDFSAFLTWSNGVRAPTLFEMFGDRGSFKGNPNLQPEEAKTLSLGSTVSYANLSFTGAFYQQQLVNSIVAIFNSSNVGSYSNVSQAELTGLELQANYKVSSDLSLMLQTNLIDSNTQSEYTAYHNKRLPGIYHQQYSAGIRYAITEHWQINLNSNIDNELYFNRANVFDSVGNSTENPANRLTTDLQLGWKKERFTAHLAINNLFDDEYQDLANRPAQGRNIQFKIAIKEI
ncbi:TonB-dependent receptor [Moritella sp. 24]|uniref:TonB-dependent receptor n=1 Tax=Moritella sp. 24 TaxID=2746230 RepID=UPI001BA55021|nr:TonB-dependent receptor [Moritella sp. 24]QUM75763.1 TonB-dependent receptor [Moritella sp. 24]